MKLTSYCPPLCLHPLIIWMKVEIIKDNWLVSFMILSWSSAYMIFKSQNHSTLLLHTLIYCWISFFLLTSLEKSFILKMISEFNMWFANSYIKEMHILISLVFHVQNIWHEWHRYIREYYNPTFFDFFYIVFEPLKILDLRYCFQSFGEHILFHFQVKGLYIIKFWSLVLIQVNFAACYHTSWSPPELLVSCLISYIMSSD